MKIALVWHGDRDARDTASLAEHRLGPTASTMRGVGLEPQAAVYNDDFLDEVRDQLLEVDAVQVWVNPIEGDRTRYKLDAMLQEVAEAGVLVSSHPETIQKMGTKRVLFETKEMSWGSDVHMYRTPAELREGLASRLEVGQPRVLKQCRGHSGHGIWKISLDPSDPSLVLARHAARGSSEQTMPPDDIVEKFEPYFAGGGLMIDQAYQNRIGEGMIRAYLVKDRIQGFGFQEINALHPAEPNPGSRLYYPPTDPRFQDLKREMESEWVGQLLTAVGVSIVDLPMLWDADFMFGSKAPNGKDRYVLCEINVSSVYPYPEWAMEPLAQAIREHLEPKRP